MFKRLFALDARGVMRVWSVECDCFELTYTWGIVGGAMQEKTEEIELNQSGRDYEEQAMLQFDSKIKKRKDMGYVDTIEEAQKGRTNALNLPRAMTAKTFNPRMNIDYTAAYIQRKYDGNRCMVANVGGELIAYSRNGKRITTIDHILKWLDFPEGTILDGELYAHGHSLQTIVSWIKRQQPNTSKLNYHAYDLIAGDNKSFADRFHDMGKFEYGPQAGCVPTIPCNNYDRALELFRGFRKDGYEGAILRHGDLPYEDGKQSRGLLKLKEWFDEEFEVKYISASKDGWAILHMETLDGGEFKATAPGTQYEKIETLVNKGSYIGRKVTIEYANITKDGIPFHPIAKGWREDNV